MHAISSYRRNRHRPQARPPQTHRQDRLQYTAALASAQCNNGQAVEKAQAIVLTHLQLLITYGYYDKSKNARLGVVCVKLNTYNSNIIVI